jgi:hypothetical protein
VQAQVEQPVQRKKKATKMIADGTSSSSASTASRTRRDRRFN